jgi:hypothetical protein
LKSLEKKKKRRLSACICEMMRYILSLNFPSFAPLTVRPAMRSVDFKKAILAIGAFLAMGAFSAPAHAVPITSIDGTINSFVMAPGAPGTYTLTFGTSQVTQHNGVPLGTPLPTTFSVLAFNVPGVHSGSSTNYTFVDGGTKLITPLSGGMALFVMNTLTGMVPDVLTNTFLIHGFEHLVSNTTVFDYSPFTNPGSTVTFTLNIGAGDFNAMINAGATITGSASFSQVAAVPEPSSMMVFAAFAVGGMIVARRRSCAHGLAC